MVLFSSPVIHAQTGLRIDISAAQPEKLGEPMEHLTLEQGPQQKDFDMFVDWDALQSPENICIRELEDMFDAY